MVSRTWPIFDLSIRTPRLEMRLPREEEFPAFLEAVEAGIHDPDVMPFLVAWTDIEPTVERNRASVRFWWMARASWTPQDWHLTLGVWADGRAIGFQDVSAKDFATLRTVESGSWLTRDAQGHGFGTEMRAGMLQLAFDGLATQVARSAAFPDNGASIAASRALGYRDDGTGHGAPRGEVREYLRFVLDRERWEAHRPHWRAEISGLEACLELFGAAPDAQASPGASPSTS